MRDKRTADREAARLAQEAEEAKREHELEMARVQQEAELKRIAKEHELEMAKLSQPTATGDVKVGKSNPNAFKFKPKPFNERLDTLDSWFDIYDRQAEFCNLSSETKKLFLYDCFHGKYSDSLLATDKDASYEDIKKSMLANFNMTANDYRKRFFDCVPEKSETFASYLQRLEHTFNKWIDLSSCPHSYDGLRSLILSHKIFDSCNQQFVTYLLERDTSDLAKMETQASAYFQAHSGASLAKNSDSYLNANAAAAALPRRGRFQNKHERDKSSYRSSSYDKKKPWFKGTGNKPKGKDYNRTDEGSTELVCFKCQMPGHIKPKCPLSDEEARLVRDALMKVNKDSGNKDNSSRPAHSSHTQSDEVSDDSDASDDSLSSNQSATKPWDNKHIYSGYLKHGNAFKPVAILRDTGSAVHAVHEQFITKEQLLPNTQKIITFGGKSESFSLAEIQVDTPFISGTITACVLRDYPDNFKNYDILIGNGDVLGSPVAHDPHPDLISSWTSDHENVLQSNQVDTRSSSKKSQEARITSLASYFNISHLLHFIFLIFCIFCIDFRSVSSQTVSMSVPIPDQDLLFAKFDLCEELWQIRTSPESRPITAFQAGGESYQFSCIQFLGHLVGGVRLTPSDNTKKIIKLKVPTTQKKEKSLLGLIDFYGKISTIMTPIYSKLVGKADPKNIDWTVDCDNTLLAVKKAISA